MNTELQRNNDAASPFDAIRRVRDDGSEFWSARDLQPLLGYTEWRNFERCLTEARRAADITAAQDQFVDVNKSSPQPNGGVREIADVEMTRFGAYMVAMSCDGSKPEVAAAKTYFAVRTREAETRPLNGRTPAALPSKRELAQWFLEAEERADRETQARLEAEARANALEGPAQSWTHLASSQGSYSFADAAKILSADPNIETGRDRLFRYVSDQGWIYRDRGTRLWKAYQAQVDRGRLVEKVGKPYINAATGQTVIGPAIIQITPKCLADLHRMLGGIESLKIAEAQRVTACDDTNK